MSRRRCRTEDQNQLACPVALDPPALGDDFFVRARPALEVMGKAFMARAPKPGRFKSLSPKIEVKIRIDARNVEHLRETGRGWQTRDNAALAKLVEERRL